MQYNVIYRTRLIFHENKPKYLKFNVWNKFIWALNQDEHPTTLLIAMEVPRLYMCYFNKEISLVLDFCFACLRFLPIVLDFCLLLFDVITILINWYISTDV